MGQRRSIEEWRKANKVERFKYPSIYRVASYTEKLEKRHVTFPFRGKNVDFVVGIIEGGVPVRDIDTLKMVYPLFVLEALRRLERVKVHSISISLPIEVWYRDVKKDKQIIKHLVKGIMEIFSGEVEVLPQSYTAYRFAVEIGLINPEPTLVIDGGFNTINVSLVVPEKRGGFRLPVALSLMDSGVRKLINFYFYDYLKSEYVDLPHEEQLLNKLFLEERMRISGKVIDATKAKEEALSSYLFNILPKIEASISASTVTADYSQILVVGGLAYYLKDIEKDNFLLGKLTEGATLVVAKEEAEFYNVYGMLLKRENLPKLAIDGGFGHVKVAFSKGD